MNDYVEPTFDTIQARILFLSRLYGVAITAEDISGWQQHWQNRPTKQDDETWRAFKARLLIWRDERYSNPAWFVLSKWQAYRLGKLRPVVENYLSTRPTPTLQQARMAVRLQLETKFAERMSIVDPATQLLPLITGIVW